MPRPPEQRPAASTPQNPDNKQLRVRCAGCGGLLENYMAACARFGETPADLLVSHLCCADSCVDEYRDLGRVEWLFADSVPLNPSAPPITSIRIEHGLILAVEGTVSVVARYSHSKTHWRVRYVDARKGGDRYLPATFGKRGQAEEYLSKARERGDAEVVSRGVKDWRNRRGER